MMIRYDCPVCQIEEKKRKREALRERIREEVKTNDRSRWERFAGKNLKTKKESCDGEARGMFDV